MGRTRPEELYDLSADPGEHRNLSGSEETTEIQARFRSRLGEMAPDAPLYLQGPVEHPSPPGALR